MTLLYCFIYFLYTLSIKSGTAKRAVGLDSCKFGTMYLKPSHIAIEHPSAIGVKIQL